MNTISPAGSAVYLTGTCQKDYLVTCIDLKSPHAVSVKLILTEDIDA